MRLINTLSVAIFAYFAILIFSYVGIAQADGVYKWRDAKGNIQYGDKPPKNAHARSFNMPAITIIENYGEQWKPLQQSNSAPVRKSKSIVRSQPIVSAPIKVFKPSYNSLRFIAPKANQLIKAKDGDVSAMISLKPPLKKGHKVVFVLNGEKSSSTKSRITNFSNLSSGSHSVSANIINASGVVVMKGAIVPFQVKR